jgi:hypothetical protein
MVRNSCWIVLSFLLLIACSAAWAGDKSNGDNEKPYAVVEDLQGKRLEGYLSVFPKEVTVTSKEKEEKTLPLKAIESITLEKVNPGIPGANLPSGGGFYSVRLKNSQEVYALTNKYSLHINTELGVMIREIDPDTVQSFFRKDPAPVPTPSTTAPLIRNQSVIFSIELKF